MVDAGYLFSTAAPVLCGQPLKRDRLTLNAEQAVAALREFARQVSGLPLLRIYWYDEAGAVSAQSVAELSELADVKVRLGVGYHKGQQTTVTALIGEELTTLAAGHAIADAVLMSGDADLRLAVNEAQSWGVRVHLLGLHPSRNNQSPVLRQAADTRTEWTVAEVSRFMALANPPASGNGAGASVTEAEAGVAEADLAPFLGVVRESLAALNPDQVRTALTEYANFQRLPVELDRPLLGRAKLVLGRLLSDAERVHLRLAFVRAAREQLEGSSPAIPGAGASGT